MNNYLSREISVFPNVYTQEGTTTTLRQFLFDEAGMEAVLKYRALVQQFGHDSEVAKKFKIQLPAATISGTFYPTKEATNLVQHSGLICIDIDSKDNVGLDMGALKNQLAEVPQVLFTASSVSGSGLYCIIPLLYPERHQQQFAAIMRDFSRIGVVIDKNCKNVNRLRTISVDADFRLNQKAIPYQGIVLPERKAVTYTYTQNDTTLERVAQCCRQLQEWHIDLTSNYDTWVQIGFSLASLGESGRQFYHMASSINDKYNESECDKKFDDLLKHGQSFSIGTFFYYCQQWGINRHGK